MIGAVYVVTDPGAPIPVLDQARAAARGGAWAVQLRDKTASDAEIARLAETLLAELAPGGLRVFVNDRVEVARATGADLHLGQGDGDPAQQERPPAGLASFRLGGAGAGPTSFRSFAHRDLLGRSFAPDTPIGYSTGVGMRARRRTAPGARYHGAACAVPPRTHRPCSTAPPPTRPTPEREDPPWPTPTTEPTALR